MKAKLRLPCSPDVKRALIAVTEHLNIGHGKHRDCAKTCRNRAPMAYKTKNMKSFIYSFHITDIPTRWNRGPQAIQPSGETLAAADFPTRKYLPWKLQSKISWLLFCKLNNSVSTHFTRRLSRRYQRRCVVQSVPFLHRVSRQKRTLRFIPGRHPSAIPRTVVNGGFCGEQLKMSKNPEAGYKIGLSKLPYRVIFLCVVAERKNSTARFHMLSSNLPNDGVFVLIKTGRRIRTRRSG